MSEKLKKSKPMKTDRLPPTDEALRDDATRPYFLWWTNATVGDFKAHLASPDLEARAYWLGALLREANTRDVWLFVTPDEIREMWPRLLRYLGRSREMWAWLLQLPKPEWPPVRPGVAKVEEARIESGSIAKDDAHHHEEGIYIAKITR